MEMARHARALIAQNLGFSMIYNVVTIPLALFGVLTPAIAALLMSSSSLIVMLNALRLRMPK
jgi:Cu2+-exporting ATPase